MKHNMVALVGGGCLGMAIARGMMRGQHPSDGLIIAQRNPEKRAALEREGWRVQASISDFSRFGVVILAIKSPDAAAVLRTIGQSADRETIVISAVSGMPAQQLSALLDDSYPLIRVKFSVFVEIGQSVIPVYPCNAFGSAALDRLAWLFEPLGTPLCMSEVAMELSGWELSTLPGIIIAQLLRERLSHVRPEDLPATELLIRAGILSLGAYLDKTSRHGQPLDSALDDLRSRIVTPGGANSALFEFFAQHDFWRMADDARAIFATHLKVSPIDVDTP